MTIYYATSGGLKKIQDKGESGIYFCPGHTNCLTYTPHNVNLELDPLNVTVIGNPTIDNGVVWNITKENRVEIDTPLTLANNDFEFLAYVCLTSESNAYNDIFRRENILALSLNSNRQPHCNFGDGSTWMSDITGSQQLDLNKNYFLKVERKNNVLTLSYKEEGATDYVIAGTREITYSIPQTDIVFIGVDTTPYNIPFTGSINLAQSYIKLNDSIWWKGGTGSLTLKAGSKVYFPNGEDIFEEYTIPSDLKVTHYYNNTNMLVFVRKSDKILNTAPSGKSGDILPTATESYNVYYNTIENKCYWDTGSWEECSFPIALVNSSSAGYTSINQTFQWCGFIGSTVFVLPGVKGLCSNGFNADETYKVNEKTIDRVYVATRTWDASTNQYMAFRFDNDSFWYWNYLLKGKTVPTPNNYAYWLDTTENKMYLNNSDNSVTSKPQFTPVDNVLWLATVDGNGTSNIASLTPYNVQTAHQLVPIEQMYRDNQLVYDVSQFTPGEVVTEIANPSSTQSFTFEITKPDLYKVWLVGGGNGTYYCFYACHYAGSAAGWIGQLYFKKPCFVKIVVGSEFQSSWLQASENGVDWVNLIQCATGGNASSAGPGNGAGAPTVLTNNDFCTFQNVELNSGGYTGGSSGGSYGASVYGGYGSGGTNGYGKIEFLGKV